MPRRIVIVGANAAGVQAASAARKKDRTAEITLITEEKTAGYSRCGLPFVIGGQIPSFKDLVVYPPAYFKMLKLDLKNETKVTAINTEEKSVTTIGNADNGETLQYDSLIIATEHGIKSIAFPGISTGIYRFPKEAAAKIAMAEVVDFLGEDSLINEVIFVCFDDEMYDIYLRVLEDIN